MDVSWESVVSYQISYDLRSEVPGITSAMDCWSRKFEKEP